MLFPASGIIGYLIHSFSLFEIIAWPMDLVYIYLNQDDYTCDGKSTSSTHDDSVKDMGEFHKRLLSMAGD